MATAEGAASTPPPARRCVVTGATGLIGSHLLRVLAPEWEVHALTRWSAPAEPTGVRWHEADLATGAGLDTLPPAVDVVVFLAQSARFREFPEHAADIAAVNVDGVLRLLEYARRARATSFVLASTGGVYAPSRDPLREDGPTAPHARLGFYGATKLAAELLATQYQAYLATVILRYFFVYGPGQHDSMLIPRLARAVRDGTPIVLQGPDGLRCNPTYVDDAVAATRRAMTIDHPAVINVAGPDVVNLRTIANAMGRMVGRVPIFDVRDGTRTGDLVADLHHMRTHLIAPTVGLASGLRRYFEGSA